MTEDSNDSFNWYNGDSYEESSNDATSYEDHDDVYNISYEENSNGTINYDDLSDVGYENDDDTYHYFDDENSNGTINDDDLSGVDYENDDDAYHYFDDENSNGTINGDEAYDYSDDDNSNGTITYDDLSDVDYEEEQHYWTDRVNKFKSPEPQDFSEARFSKTEVEKAIKYYLLNDNQSSDVQDELKSIIGEQLIKARGSVSVEQLNGSPWHTLAQSCEDSEIHNVMSLIGYEELSNVLKEKNNSGDTLLSVVSERIKKHLSWLLSIKKDRFYSIYFPPKVLVICNHRGPGSEEELKAVQDWMPKFSLEPVIYDTNPRRDDVLEKIRKESNSEDISAFVVIIMTHGQEGHLIFDDGQGVNIQEVIDSMCSSQLVTKPKLLIIQACQSRSKTTKDSKSQHDSTMIDACPANPRIAPQYDIKNKADMTVIISSAAGGLANRTAMIPSLFRHVSKFGRLKDIKDAFDATSRAIQREHPGQVPEFRTTMNEKFTLGNHFFATT